MRNVCSSTCRHEKRATAKCDQGSVLTRFSSLFCRVSIATKHVKRKVNYRISLLGLFFSSSSPLLPGCFSLSLIYSSSHITNSKKKKFSIFFCFNRHRLSHNSKMLTAILLDYSFSIISPSLQPTPPRFFFFFFPSSMEGHHL